MKRIPLELALSGALLVLVSCGGSRDAAPGSTTSTTVDPLSPAAQLEATKALYPMPREALGLFTEYHRTLGQGSKSMTYAQYLGSLEGTLDRLDGLMATWGGHVKVIDDAIDQGTYDPELGGTAAPLRMFYMTLKDQTAALHLLFDATKEQDSDKWAEGLDALGWPPLGKNFVCALYSLTTDSHASEMGPEVMAEVQKGSEAWLCDTPGQDPPQPN